FPAGARGSQAHSYTVDSWGGSPPMTRSSFRAALLAAAVVFPVACTRSPRQGGAEHPAGQSARAPGERTTQVLRARLSAPQPPGARASDGRSAEVWSDLRRLYESNGYAALWTNDGRPRTDIEVLRRAVAQAAADGLDPRAYDLSAADVLTAAGPRHPFKG